MELGKVTMRDCVRDDAAQIARLYNKLGYGPITSGRPMKVEDIDRFFKETDIILFLCLEYENNIIGTMLFSGSSGQKAADDHAVWGGKFLLHPQFRQGPLPSMLFSEAIKRLTQLGYQYIDVEVDPTNSVALPLYKRVGFIRSEAREIDEDGYVTLRNYLPLLIYFLQTGYHVEEMDEGLIDEGWKHSLTVKNVRSCEQDTHWLHGMETYQYKLTFGRDVISCWIDMRSEQVAMMEDPRLRFFSYIVEGQELTVGQTVKVVFEYENRLDKQVLAIFETSIGDQALPYRNGKRKRLLAPGEVIKWEEKLVVTANLVGAHRLQSSVRFGECAFLFQYGVKVTEPIEAFLQGVAAMIVAKSEVVALIIRNHQYEPFSGVVEITPCEPEQLVLDSDCFMRGVVIGGKSEHVIPLRLKAMHAGIHQLQLRVFYDTTACVYVKEIDIPVITPFSVARYQVNNHSYLENCKVKVKVDHRTGGIQLIERITGEEVVREACPDLGMPFNGMINKMPTHDLLILASNQENAWLIVVLHEGRVRLLRKLSLSCGGGMVKIEDFAVEQEKVLKLSPWCAIKNAVIRIPFLSGTVRETYMYEDFPYLLNDFEYVRDHDLPSDPQAYREPWSLFENDKLSVRFTWEGDPKAILYGLRWMPAVIFNCVAEDSLVKRMNSVWFQQLLMWRQRITGLDRLVRKSIENRIAKTKPDATHYYEVTYAKPELSSADCKDMSRVNLFVNMPEVVTKGQQAILSCRVETVHVCERMGEVTIEIPALGIKDRKAVKQLRAENKVDISFTIDVNTDKQRVEGKVSFSDHSGSTDVHEAFYFYVKGLAETVILAEKQQKSAHVLSMNNGLLELEIAPALHGALTRLKYRSQNIVDSHFPYLKSWGQNTSTPGGIHPHHFVGKGNEIIFSAENVTSFRYEMITGTWEGVRCIAKEYMIDYITLPRMPGLKVSLSLLNATAPVEQCVILHSFWRKLGQVRHMYYWNHLGRNKLSESRRRRRVYSTEAKVIVDLGKDVYVTVWAEEKRAQLVITEWPDKGFQLSVLSSRCNQKISAFVMVSRSYEEAAQYILKMGES